MIYSLNKKMIIRSWLLVTISIGDNKQQARYMYPPFKYGGYINLSGVLGTGLVLGTTSRYI